MVSLDPSLGENATPSAPANSYPASAIHTYHCLCSTHLLTTPYILSELRQRAPPSLDHARILPFPSASLSIASEQANQYLRDIGDEQQQQQQQTSQIMPSLLSSNIKPVKKPVVVQREDGWEKRRLWRCGRCGITVGYEIMRDEELAEDVTDGGKAAEEVGKVSFLLEGGLMETGKWDG